MANAASSGGGRRERSGFGSDVERAYYRLHQAQEQAQNLFSGLSAPKVTRQSTFTSPTAARVLLRVFVPDASGVAGGVSSAGSKRASYMTILASEDQRVHDVIQQVYDMAVKRSMAFVADTKPDTDFVLHLQLSDKTIPLEDGTLVADAVKPARSPDKRRIDMRLTYTPKKEEELSVSMAAGRMRQQSIDDLEVGLRTRADSSSRKKRGSEPDISNPMFHKRVPSDISKMQSRFTEHMAERAEPILMSGTLHHNDKSLVGRIWRERLCTLTTKGLVVLRSDANYLQTQDAETYIPLSAIVAITAHDDKPTRFDIEWIEHDTCHKEKYRCETAEQAHSWQVALSNATFHVSQEDRDRTISMFHYIKASAPTPENGAIEEMILLKRQQHPRPPVPPDSSTFEPPPLVRNTGRVTSVSVDQEPEDPTEFLPPRRPKTLAHLERPKHRSQLPLPPASSSSSSSSSSSMLGASYSSSPFSRGVPPRPVHAINVPKFNANRVSNLVRAMKGLPISQYEDQSGGRRRRRSSLAALASGDKSQRIVQKAIAEFRRFGVLVRSSRGSRASQGAGSPAGGGGHDDKRSSTTAVGRGPKKRGRRSRRWSVSVPEVAREASLSGSLMQFCFDRLVRQAITADSSAQFRDHLLNIRRHDRAIIKLLLASLVNPHFGKLSIPSGCPCYNCAHPLAPSLQDAVFSSETPEDPKVAHTDLGRFRARLADWALAQYTVCIRAVLAALHDDDAVTDDLAMRVLYVLLQRVQRHQRMAQSRWHDSLDSTNGDLSGVRSAVACQACWATDQQLRQYVLEYAAERGTSPAVFSSLLNVLLVSPLHPRFLRANEPHQIHPNSMVLNPASWGALLAAAAGADWELRKEALESINLLLIRSAPNRISLLVRPEWFVILTDLLVDIPLVPKAVQLAHEIYQYAMNIFVLMHSEAFIHSDDFHDNLAGTFRGFQAVFQNSLRTLERCHTLFLSLATKLKNIRRNAFEMRQLASLPWINLLSFTRLLKLYLFASPTLGKSKEQKPEEALKLRQLLVKTSSSSSSSSSSSPGQPPRRPLPSAAAATHRLASPTAPSPPRPVKRDIPTTGLLLGDSRGRRQLPGLDDMDSDDEEEVKQSVSAQEQGQKTKDAVGGTDMPGDDIELPEDAMKLHINVDILHSLSPGMMSDEKSPGSGSGGSGPSKPQNIKAKSAPSPVSRQGASSPGARQGLRPSVHQRALNKQQRGNTISSMDTQEERALAETRVRQLSHTIRFGDRLEFGLHWDEDGKSYDKDVLKVTTELLNAVKRDLVSRVMDTETKSDRELQASVDREITFFTNALTFVQVLEARSNTLSPDTMQQLVHDFATSPDPGTALAHAFHKLNQPSVIGSRILNPAVARATRASFNIPVK